MITVCNTSRNEDTQRIKVYVILYMFNAKELTIVDGHWCTWYIRRFCLKDKVSQFSPLFSIEIKCQSYKDKRIWEKYMNLHNLSIFTQLLLSFSFIYVVLQIILCFSSWNFYPIVLHSNFKLSNTNIFSHTFP